MRIIGGRPVVFSSTQRILLRKCKIRLLYKCMTVELEFMVCHPEKKRTVCEKTTLLLAHESAARLCETNELTLNTTTGISFDVSERLDGY